MILVGQARRRRWAGRGAVPRAGRLRLPLVKVLVIGTGAREHAIVRALTLDPSVDAVIAAPGKPGIDTIALCRELHEACWTAAAWPLWRLSWVWTWSSSARRRLWLQV